MRRGTVIEIQAPRGHLGRLGGPIPQKAASANKVRGFVEEALSA